MVNVFNEENFDSEVINSDKTTIVDFYADWCGPCKMMAPIIDTIAEEIGDKAKICKLNVDEAQDISIEYNVMSIPTLIIFKNGEVFEKLVGLQDKTELMDNIKRAL